MPTMVHAGVYASVLHYLKAVDATKGKDATAVMAKMKEIPRKTRCSAGPGAGRRSPCP